MHLAALTLEAAFQNVEEADGVAELELAASDRVVHLSDMSHTFVANREGLCLIRSLDGDDVCMAQRSRCQLDQYLVGAWHGRGDDVCDDLVLGRVPLTGLHCFGDRHCVGLGVVVGSDDDNTLDGDVVVA